MRAFVTGATGLLGGHLLRKLVEDEHDVVALVRDLRGRTPNYDDVKHRIIEVRGELSDFRTIERALFEYQIDVVFHLAAQSQVKVSGGSPFSTFESNVRGTYTVLEACRTYGKLRRAVIASSDKAYGDQPCPYTELQPAAGKYPYDASKACGDLIARSYFHTYGLPTVIVRCSNLYGPGDLNWQRIVPATCRFSFLGEPLILRGSGKMKRDYLYVSDAVDGYTKVAVAEGVDGEAFNFGNGSPVEVRDIADRVLSISGCSRSFEIEDAHDNEIRDQWMDSTKAAKLLGWSPRVSLDDGLRATVPWYGEWLRGNREALRDDADP